MSTPPNPAGILICARSKTTFGQECLGQLELESGLVASRARPRGSITGSTTLGGVAASKHLDTLQPSQRSPCSLVQDIVRD